MFKLLGKIGCVLTMLTLMDGFGMLFQVVAWTDMLMDRVPDQGIEQALETTFSGHEPCEKCIALSEAQSEKKKRDCGNTAAAEFSFFGKWVPNEVTDICLPVPSSCLVLREADLWLGIPISYGEVATPPPDSMV